MTSPASIENVISFMAGDPRRYSAHDRLRAETTIQSVVCAAIVLAKSHHYRNSFAMLKMHGPPIPRMAC